MCTPSSNMYSLSSKGNKDSFVICLVYSRCFSLRMFQAVVVFNEWSNRMYGGKYVNLGLAVHFNIVFS